MTTHDGMLSCHTNTLYLSKRLENIRKYHLTWFLQGEWTGIVVSIMQMRQLWFRKDK